jgi:segregation and condensation protein A
MRFRVQLDAFAGPLDLLWYLVRKHELDVLDIPIARVIDQYLDVLAALEQIDVDAAGDFLELATRLMEIKSRMMLPRQDEEEEQAIEDPRQDLVERLLEYKRYKDAAAALEDRGRDWQLRFGRRANDMSVGPIDPAEQPIHEVELWDLVSAFGRVVRERAPARPARIVHDDTPIEAYMRLIRSRLAAEGRVLFSSLFEPEMTRSQLAGIFLALLELMRDRQVCAEQAELFGEIWVLPAAAAKSVGGVSDADAASQG